MRTTSNPTQQSGGERKRPAQRKGRGSLGRRLVLLAASGLALLGLSPQALAQAFTCDATFYQIRGGGNSTTLNRLNRGAIPYSLDPIYSFNPLVNGLGYNPADNYLYAVSSSAPRRLYRLRASGGVDPAVNGLAIANAPAGGSGNNIDAGTFDRNGHYFVAYGGGTIIRVDGVQTASATTPPTATELARIADPSPRANYVPVANLLVGDWATNPVESTASRSVLYGLRSPEGGTIYLYRVVIDNPGTATQAQVSRIATTGLSTANAFGTIYIDATGTLYAYRNDASASGGFFSVDLATGIGTEVSGSDSTSQSDGANCPTAVVAQVPPTLVLNKLTTGGAGGPFSFTLTNTGQAQGTATTVAAGTAVQVDGDTANPGVQPFTVSAFGQPVTIAETGLPPGWSLDGASCSVGGGGVVGSFDAATRTYTIPGSAVVSAAQFTCAFTNSRQAVLRLQKAFAAGGRVQDGDQVTLSIMPPAGTAATVTTTGTGAAVTSAALVLTPAMAGTAYTLSESAAGTFAMADYAVSYACTTAAGGAGPSGDAATFAVTPAVGDDLSCVFTNAPRVADLQVLKTTASTDVNVGDTVVYTLTVTNNGPGDAHDALVQDPAVPRLNCAAPAAAPTCGNATGGAACPAGAIALSQLQGGGVAIPTLPAGGSVELTLSCVVQ